MSYGYEDKTYGESSMGHWRKFSGVLCGRTMLVKLKGKIYRTEVKLASMYGAAET